MCYRCYKQICFVLDCQQDPLTSPRRRRAIAFVLALLTGIAWVDHRDNFHGDEVYAAVVQLDDHGVAHGDDHGAGHEPGHPSLAVHRTATWFQTNGVEFTVGTLVDGLAVMMLLVVTLVSLLVHVYSTDYVHGDRRYTHFFAFLSLFSASMLLLVVSENTLQLLCAWELVGVCSFALIGHWWEEKPNSDAALKAFLSQGLEPPALIGLAKKNETIIFSDGREALNLPHHDPALRLLQHIRDEAHNFAKPTKLGD